MTQSVALISLNHLSRETADVPLSVAFYRDVLGFEPIDRPDLGFDGAWMRGGGVLLHLIKGSPPSRPSNVSTRTDHTAFAVADLAEAERRLGFLGVAVVCNKQTSTGLKQLFFQDPDGNVIELACYSKER